MNMKNLRLVMEENMKQTPFGRALLDWARENLPQDTEQHPADALDALTYTCGIDPANGTDYGCEIKGHKALAPDGREILVIDEMHLLPPLTKNEGVLLQITVGGGGNV